MSRGTLRKRKYLIAADEPGALLEPVERVERRRLELRARRAGFASPLLGRHLDRVEPGLGAVDVDARHGAAVLHDPRAGARALDVARRCRTCRGQRLPLRIENSARSSARTGGPAVRFPSVSYWPPWHGQPKPTASTADQVDVVARTPSSSPRRSARSAAPGSRGARSASRSIVKLGSPSSRPLLRMYTVRRVTSPTSGSSQVRGDHELALGEVLDRAEVDVLVAPGS